MKGKIILLVAFAMVLGAAGFRAHAATEAGAPGMLPGTWIGTGTLGGSLVEGGAAARYAGPIRFRLIVDGERGVSGQGSWSLRRYDDGTGDVAIKGWAALALSGTSTNLTLAGTRYVIGEALAGPARSVRSEQLLDSRLEVATTGACHAGGTTRIGRSSLRWIAHRTGRACA